MGKADRRFGSGARFGVFTLVGPEADLGLGEGWRAEEKRDDGRTRSVGLDLWPVGDFEAEALKAVQARDRVLAKGLSKLPGVAGPRGSLVEKDTLVRTMALPHGLTMKELLSSETILSDSIALVILRDVAGILTLVHEVGLYHGLLRSQWVRIDAGGQVELAGFGAVECPAVVDRVPTSPEQALGAQIDARADVFAFGLLAWELLTGESPVAADTPEEMENRLLTLKVPSIETFSADLPEAVAGTLNRSLARRPADRPGSMREVMDILSKAVQERYASEEEARQGLSDWWGGAQNDGDPTLFGPAGLTPTKLPDVRKTDVDIEVESSTIEMPAPPLGLAASQAMPTVLDPSLEDVETVHGVSTMEIRRPTPDEEDIKSMVTPASPSPGIRLPTQTEINDAVSRTPTVEREQTDDVEELVTVSDEDSPLPTLVGFKEDTSDGEEGPTSEEVAEAVTPNDPTDVTAPVSQRSPLIGWVALAAAVTILALGLGLLFSS